MADKPDDELDPTFTGKSNTTTFYALFNYLMGDAGDVFSGWEDFERLYDYMTELRFPYQCDADNGCQALNLAGDKACRVCGNTDPTSKTWLDSEQIQKDRDPERYP